MIKIKGKRSYIDVYLDDKIVRIQGEMMYNGFLALKDSIKTWKVPEGMLITDEEKNRIIDSVLEKSRESHMVIVFV